MTYMVYEFVSGSRQEIYVGVTDSPHTEPIRLRAIAPPELAGWPPGDLEKLRPLEAFQDLDEARRFARTYARQAAPRSWRVILAGEVPRA